MKAVAAPRTMAQIRSRMTTDWNIRVLLDDLAHRADKPALMAIQNGLIRELASSDLANRARSLASFLLRMGVAPGEPVALIGPNGFEWVIARLGIEAAGAVAVAIDEQAAEPELRSILAQSNVKHVICSIEHVDALRRFSSGLGIIAFGHGMTPPGVEDFVPLISAAVGTLPHLDPGAPIMLGYTSGTTGTPKAIALTGRNVATNVEALVASNLVGARDRVLLPLPLHHVYPLVIGLLTALAIGATVVFPESVAGPDILAAVRLADVTTIVGVPRLYGAICSGLLARVNAAGLATRTLFRLSVRASAALRRATGLNPGVLLFSGLRERFGGHLRLLVSGGAHLDIETLQTLAGLGFDVRSGYGLAETASMYTANLPFHTRWGSEGKPIAGEIRIGAPDKTGTGEIELKGPQLFSQYRDNSEATRAAFTADGWFRTGDLGYVDHDGFLFVTGRMKETLVLGGGKKVNPEDLERVYGVSPYIREIAILEHKGTLVALVVPSLDAARVGGAAHIDTAIRVELTSRAQTLPSYQRLAGFVIVREPLPRTRLGKYRRFLLPQIYETAEHPSRRATPVQPSIEDKQLLKQPLARQVYEILKSRYPDKNLSLDASPLLDLGIDSLEWISFGLELQETLHLQLTESAIGNVTTVRDLLLAALNAAPAPAPHPAELHEWTAPLGPAMKLYGAVLYALDWFAMRALFRLEVRGEENLPNQSNFVLIANHSSYLDAPSLGAALGYRTVRRCYWAGDPVVLFSKRWHWPFLRAMQCYPVFERAPAHSLAVSAAILERGNNLVWFPEGWRSPDGKLQSFLPGIGHLLARTPTTVVPVNIAGTFEALPRGRSLPRLRRIRVVIGAPIAPERWQALMSAKKDVPQTITDLLHRVIEDLGRRMAKPSETGKP